MFIERLIVRQTSPSEGVVRNIKFNKKGLSLIVDNTISGTEDSGNSVGKTTVIKLIDLCLGAKTVKDIYYDSDTRSENAQIKEYINNNKLQAELILKDAEGNLFSLKRDLYNRGKKYINDVVYTEEEYKHRLKQIIFASSQPLPTFRQLIPKFVRLSNSSEDSMIKYLPQMTRNDDYEAVYSFFFNIMENSLVSERNRLNSQLLDCQRAIAVLEKNKSISSISSLKQKEELIEADLNELVQKRQQFSYMDTYKEELKNKREINVQIDELQKKTRVLAFEVATMEESVEKLEKEKNNIDMSVLEVIYAEAKNYIPELQKSFQDVVEFHNVMIQNRIDFINQQLNNKVCSLNKLNERINELLELKGKITIDILDEGLLDELNSLNLRIETLSVQKGELSQSIRLLEEQERTKEYLIKELQQIDTKLDKESIENKMKVFNQTFSEYCYKLYGEKYVLAYNSNWKREKKFPVTSESLGGNVGTGKKKALIVAFDLAYIKYADVMRIKSPRFVIHDKLENTHINQLKTIFNISKNINGQYILPILRERISEIDDANVKKLTVLELSENDKFFKV